MTTQSFRQDMLDDDKSLSEYDVIGLDAVEDQEDNESDSAGSAGAREEYRHIDESLLLTPDVISNGKKLYTALDYKTYETFVAYNIQHADRYLQSNTFSYDIETNAEDPLSGKAKIIGFSNAFEPNSGIYVVREALDYTMPAKDWEAIVAHFIRLMKFSDHIIVHNRKYENPYTVNCMGYEISNEKIEDTMIKCRVIYPGEQAGLKPAAARLLGYSDWDALLGMYTRAVKGIIEQSVVLKGMKKVSEKRKSDYRLYEQILAFQEIVDPLVLHVCFKKKLYEMTEYAMHWVSVLQVLEKSDLMNMNIFGLLVAKINEIVAAGGLETSVIPYSMIPIGVLAKYGALDAIATYELNDFCDLQFDKKSQEIQSILRSITQDTTYDTFNLRTGYEIVKAQFDAGVNLEMAGAHWDDDIAEQEFVWHNDKAIESWYALFKNEKFATAIKNGNKANLMKTIIVKNLALGDLELDDTEEVELLDADFIPCNKIIQTKILDYLKTYGELKLQKSQVKFLDIIIDNGLTGAPKCVKYSALYLTYTEDFDRLLNDEYEYAFARMIDRSKISDYTQLKDYYNPSRSRDDHYEMVHRIMLSLDLLYAVMYAACMKQITLDKYWERLDPNFFAPTVWLFTYLVDVRQKNEQAKLSGGTQVSQLEIFEQFKNLVTDAVNNANKDSVILKMYKAAQDYKISSLKEPVLLDLYNKLLIMGVNPEVESTWSQEYLWLYNFRTYRKCVKIITSYVHGSVGRKSVTVIDKNHLNDLLPIRKRSYYEGNGQFDPLTEDLLMSIEFGVCTAETGRWRSGFHTVPAGSTIKNIYTSRFDGGVICSPDYSQMEVRAIAATAAETGMLNAFNAGEDIHQRTAASVYQKAKEAVTDTERKFSKAVTFAVIYGASEHNIADNFMNSDYAKAKEVMDSFFVTYPKLKTWIDTMHKLWRMTGYVAIASNRLIKIEIPERTDPKYNMKMSKGPRCAQNYPIQGLSSDVAGYVLYLLIKHIKTNHMQSRAFSFVHDALYFDIHPMELFKMLIEIKHQMNDYPMQTYQLPAAADMVVGASMGQELKLKELNQISDTEGYLTLSGFQDDFDLLLEKWQSVYASVTYEELDKPQQVYVPKSDLFAPKKTISKHFGSYRFVVKRKVHIIMQ